MKLIKWTASTTLGLALTACGPAMKPATELGNNGSQNCNGCTSGVNPDQTEEKWKSIDLNGAMSGGPYFEANAIGLDRPSQSIDLKLPMPQNPFGQQEFTADIPELPGAKVGLVQDASGQWAITLRIPLKYLVKGVDVGVPGTLPNGDELPGIPGAERPVMALDIHRLGRTITVYVGLQAAAVFVPTPEFNPYVGLGFPIRNKSQRQVVGYFATVPKKSTFAGGFYMAAVIPDAVARVLEEILMY